jgi:bacterioferritin-associated ferredoxin
VILCQCKKVTDEQFLAAMDGSSLLELQKRLGFASGMARDGKSACGSCMPNFVKLYHDQWSRG